MRELYTSVLGPKQVVVAPWAFFIKSEMWECWISVIAGTVTAFPGDVMVFSPLIKQIHMHENCHFISIFMPQGHTMFTTCPLIVLDLRTRYSEHEQTDFDASDKVVHTATARKDQLWARRSKLKVAQDWTRLGGVASRGLILNLNPNWVE